MTAQLLGSKTERKDHCKVDNEARGGRQGSSAMVENGAGQGGQKEVTGAVPVVQLSE